MVPIKLTVSNFTSYGETPQDLDFTQFHLAAISGLNGAGKSSLLDAITWCLWGSSRAGDSADSLIHLGAIEMQVDFTFSLDEHNFIVKRKRNKKSGGHTSLEFWSGSHNLTEGTIKATQQKIIEVLHLTFETFSNSAFLRQGHADEFTQRGATDRKRILADILGLDHYDKLEEKAKEKAKEAQTHAVALDYQLLELEAEIMQKEEREKALVRIEIEYRKAETELKQTESLIKSIEDEKQIVVTKIQSLKEKSEQIKKVKIELAELKVQIEIKEKAKLEYQKILDQKQLIEEKCKELTLLQDKKKTLEAKRSELIKVKDEFAELLKLLNVREDKRKKAIADLEVELKEFETRNAQLEAQNKELGERKDLCPTCGQIIGEEKNKEIIEKNNKLVNEYRLKVNDLRLKIEKYQSIILPEKAQVQEKEVQIKILENETKDWGEINSQIILLEKYADLNLKLAQAETAVKTHTEAILNLQKLLIDRESQILASEKILEELSIFETKIRETEEKIRAQMIIKEELSQKTLELKGQAGEAKQLMSRVAQMEIALKQKTEEKAKLSKEKEIYEELALAFGKKGIQAMIIETAIPEIEDEANRLLDKLTEGRMKVSFQTQRETKTKVVGAEGKKDFATVETLDIVISDEMGERPYELYSGGETFRVNFAIRLAISKLLSHRAGAKLQFLVIDEGFGTQDTPGRARLVEVLDVIRNDFEKIVIITHIDELKEEFATRIEVTKAQHGSTFQVVGG